MKHRSVHLKSKFYFKNRESKVQSISVKTELKENSIHNPECKEKLAKPAQKRSKRIIKKSRVIVEDDSDFHVSSSSREKEIKSNLVIKKK